MKTTRYCLVLILLLWFSIKSNSQDKLIINDTLPPTDEQTCRTKIFQYYQVKGKYHLSSSVLVKQANQYLREKNVIPQKDGNITFRFLVTCGGSTTSFKIFQLTPDYINTSFDLPVVNNLYLYLKSLTGWKKALYKGASVSYWAYLTFKIYKGEVINVIP